jgi:cell division septation protein DedD
MPDLNLIDDEGLSESPKPTPTKPGGKKGGGGGVATIMVVFIVVILLIGGTFILNKLGIIKLWGHKKPVPVQTVENEPTQMVQDTLMQQESPQYPSDQAVTEQPALEQPSETQEAAQTSSVASMTGDYTIQVFTFAEEKNATTICSRLTEAGYPAYIDTVVVKGKKYNAVRIGKYATRKEAQEAVKNFGEELRANYIIHKIRL